MSDQPGDKYLNPEARARVEILEDLTAAAGELAAATSPADEED
jgi:hypothetical protein